MSVQNRLPLQDEVFVRRYGIGAAAGAPPIRPVLGRRGLKVEAGTNATRVSAYTPWVAPHWLVTGRTAGDPTIRPPHNRVDRETALEMLTTPVPRPPVSRTARTSRAPGSSATSPCCRRTSSRCPTRRSRTSKPSRRSSAAASSTVCRSTKASMRPCPRSPRSGARWRTSVEPGRAGSRVQGRPPGRTAGRGRRRVRTAPAVAGPPRPGSGERQPGPRICFSP
ncbi:MULTISPECIES: amidohydrolase family protein [Streptomyces]|uniref:Amidohydrolase family protein n=1 Tax=Streptomyces eurythermus TaxID=42237 RepID=A0ABW6Z4F2_9ACTN